MAPNISSEVAMYDFTFLPSLSRLGMSYSPGDVIRIPGGRYEWVIFFVSNKRCGGHEIGLLRVSGSCWHCIFTLM